MKRKFIRIGIGIAICVLVGSLAGKAVEESLADWYPALAKPPFSPPQRLLVPIWTLLYVLMGISAGLVWAKGLHHLWVKTALYHFAFQLLVTVLWTLVFFGLRDPFWGLLVIVALLGLIFFTLKWFRIASRPAALLLLPYLLWVGYMGVVNYGIWTANP